MNLGFKDQFIPMVEDGSKRHTIRAGERWRVGMRADLWRQMRRPKVFELRATNIPPGCICHGDGLMGMRCTAPVHAPANLEYEQVQTAGQSLIFRAPVIKVERIEIMCFPDDRPDGWPSAKVAPLYAKTKIAIEGLIISADELNVFAWRDGFRAIPAGPSDPYKTPFQQMVGFWAKQHRFGHRTIRFEGQIVHWDYGNRFMEMSETCYWLSRSKAMQCTSMACSKYGEPVGRAHSCVP